MQPGIRTTWHVGGGGGFRLSPLSLGTAAELGVFASTFVHTIWYADCRPQLLKMCAAH